MTTFPNQTISWQPCLPVPSSSFIFECLFFKRSLKYRASLLSRCLWFPFPVWTVQGGLGAAPGALKGGVGRVRGKGNAGRKARKAHDFSAVHYAVHWAGLLLFSNGFFNGKLTFCLNRSNSHWAIILSLPGVCASLEGDGHLLGIWLGVQWCILPKRDCLLLHLINSQRLPHKVMWKSLGYFSLTPLRDKMNFLRYMLQIGVFFCLFFFFFSFHF